MLPGDGGEGFTANSPAWFVQTFYKACKRLRLKSSRGERNLFITQKEGDTAE